MPAPLSSAEKIIIAAAATLITVNFIWGMLKKPRYRRSRESLVKRQPQPPSGPTFREVFAEYLRARQSGSGIRDSIKSAYALLPEIPETDAMPPPAVAVSPTSRFLGLVQAVLVNSVTILGVFTYRWPVGTGLALYWSETVIVAFLLFILSLFWRRETDSLGFQIGVSAAFSAAHFVFLLFMLGVILPRIAPAERFEGHSFERGLAAIAILLLLDFVRNAFVIRRNPATEMQRAFVFYMRRVIVLHMTIIIGMFALLLFGTPRSFFAVFAGLKGLADLSRRA